MGARVVLVTLLLALCLPARAVERPVAPAFSLVGGRTPAVQDSVTTGSPHGTIALTCEACHTPEAWRPLLRPLPFDHDRHTAFPLTGRHRQADCRACHLGLRFDPPDLGTEAGGPAAPEACASCHLDVHRGQLGPACGSCHSTADFAVVEGVALHARTAFPLTGAHLTLACEACHEADLDGAFAPLDPSCLACHEADYAATASSAVDHVAAGFPTDCAACHTTLSFGTGTVFDHAAVSGGFALVGAHARAECTACHAAGDLAPLFEATSQDDCVACHQADYDATASGALVDHVAAGLPTDCLLCHTVGAWAGATADHALLSGGFSLVGAHLALDCEACHRGPGFDVPENPASQDDCVACHADDHAREHPSFPTTCLDCHGTTSWGGAAFDHEAATGFPLLGAHLALDCAVCHTLPGFEPIWEPTSADDCYTCHAEDHEDEHPDFPTTCLDCHGTTSWGGASFDHGAVTGFALVGAHLPLACEACHTLPDFGLIWTPAGQDDCFACHADEHEDEHPDFPTTCLDCHNVNTWEDPDFNHGAVTGFPLLGAHVQLDCAACHTLPGYGLIWDPAHEHDCYTCHEDDYQDEHAGSGFPTTCLDCHDVDTWEGAEFEHDPYFPIYSGKHEDEWNTCADCHHVPGNFEIFSCIDCHEHRRSEMDEAHEDVGGYVYESNACYACHPDGEDLHRLEQRGIRRR